MLAEGYRAQINTLVEQLESRIRMPEEWADTYFSESGVQSTSYDERRRFVRFRVRTKGVLAIQQTLVSIPRDKGFHIIYTHNAARGGFGFLHADQLYPCELCDLWLPTHKLTVEVTRCQYLNEQCYLIGARPVSKASTPIGK